MLAATSHIANALMFGTLVVGTAMHMVGVPSAGSHAVGSARAALAHGSNASRAIRLLATPPAVPSEAPRVLSPSSPLLPFKTLPSAAAAQTQDRNRDQAATASRQRKPGIVPPLVARKNAVAPAAPANGKAAGKGQAKGALDTSERSALGVGGLKAKRCVAGERLNRRKGRCVALPGSSRAKAAKARAAAKSRPKRSQQRR